MDREPYTGPKAGYAYQDGRYEVYPPPLSVVSRTTPPGPSRRNETREILGGVLMVVVLVVAVIGAIWWANRTADRYNQCVNKAYAAEQPAPEEMCGSPNP